MSMVSHDKKYHVTLNDVVQIVFIILKLCRLVDWSWWLVLIPVWISLGFTAVQGIVLMAKHKASSQDKEQDKEQD